MMQILAAQVHNDLIDLELSPSLPVSPFIPWSVDCRGSYEFFLLMYAVLRQSLFLDEVQSSSLSDAIN